MFTRCLNVLLIAKFVFICLKSPDKLNTALPHFLQTGDLDRIDRNTVSQDMLLVYSEKTLRESLLAISEHRIPACNISTVEIDLSIPPTNLNRLLMELSEVDTLTIRIPPVGEASSSAILKNVTFPRLQFFATTLHHGALVDFFLRHPSITSLYLDACGLERCPIPSSYLPNLSEISGPTSCAAAAIHGNPVQAVSAKDHGTLPVLPLLYISMRSSTANITRLQLDFLPTDNNILRSIRLAAPRILSLKLTEILNVCD